MEKIYIPKKGKSSVVMIYVPVGSRYEPDSIKGISHFTEHMMFKGTKKRNAQQIAVEIEKYGGYMNAFTGEEMTCYYVEIANRYREKAEKVLLDMLENSVFDEKEIRKESDVIIQEIKMYEDNPMYAGWDKFNKHVFSSQSGLYLPIAGSEETVSRLTRKDFLEFYKGNYQHQGIIQIGDVSAINDIQIPAKTPIPEPIQPIHAKAKYNVHMYRRKDIQQANILIGYALNLYDIPMIDKFFMHHILNGVYNGMAGRLFTEIREKHHLVYRVRFVTESFVGGTAKWAVSLGLELSKVEKARELIIKELSKPITKKELNYSINRFLGELEIELDDPQTIARVIAMARILGIDHNELLYNYKANINRVGKSINNYIKRLNYNEHVVVGVVPEK